MISFLLCSNLSKNKSGVLKVHKERNTEKGDTMIQTDIMKRKDITMTDRQEGAEETATKNIDNKEIGKEKEAVIGKIIKRLEEKGQSREKEVVNGKIMIIMRLEEKGR